MKKIALPCTVKSSPRPGKLTKSLPQELVFTMVLVLLVCSISFYQLSSCNYYNIGDFEAGSTMWFYTYGNLGFLLVAVLLLLAILLD